MTSVEAVADRLGGAVERDVALGPYTTYRVGGPAALFLRVDEDRDLDRLVQARPADDLPVLVIGRGSNLLVSDSGFPGLAVALGEHFATVDVHGTGVRAGGSASLPVVARRTAAAGLTGFEWAVGVPGSVGGAVRMNAGGHGSDVSQTLSGVRVVDLALGEDEVVDAGSLDLGYRRSRIRRAQLVVWAEFDLAAGDVAASESTISEIVRWRREHQPGGANAGSVFTNPDGDSAGRLVESVGAKGLRIGSAEVSTKHANFIQADDGGSAEDVQRLMAEVRRRVAADAGVELVAETRMEGFTDDQVRAAGVPTTEAG